MSRRSLSPNFEAIFEDKSKPQRYPIGEVEVEKTQSYFGVFDREGRLIFELGSRDESSTPLTVSKRNDVGYVHDNRGVMGTSHISIVELTDAMGRSVTMKRVTKSAAGRPGPSTLEYWDGHRSPPLKLDTYTINSLMDMLSIRRGGGHRHRATKRRNTKRRRTARR